MTSTGKILLDLAPQPANPRNSEGAFAEFKDGSLLFIYSKFEGDSSADNAPAGLAFIRSTDGGTSWSEPEALLSAADDAAENIMSVSLLWLNSGDLGLFYFIRKGFDYGKLHLRRSSDAGKSWSQPTSCIPATGYYVTNNDRVIRLASGRLLVPAGYHRTVNRPASEQQTWDMRSTAIYFYSDDDGKSWQESNLATVNARATRSGLQEPGAIELANGLLYGWARTDLGVQYEMFSSDGGKTWTTPQPSRFSSPCSPLSMKRDPGTGHLVAVWNPVPEYITRPKPKESWTGGRTPLVCAVSRDNGESWSEPLLLEDDPQSGFCYTAMHFYQGDLLLAYCAGSVADGGCLNRLRIRRLPNPARELKR